MRRWLTAVAAALVIATSAGVAYAVSHQTFDWGLPDWVPLPVVPADNPVTREKVELGRHLFYDKRLSADNCNRPANPSCVTGLV